jgi:hypothetical protein
LYAAESSILTKVSVDPADHSFDIPRMFAAMIISGGFVFIPAYIITRAASAGWKKTYSPAWAMVYWGGLPFAAFVFLVFTNWASVGVGVFIFLIAHKIRWR